MKYHGKMEREGEYFYGWVSTAVICEAMRRAIENVGYENLDGPAIKEALDGMQDFDVYGLASITYKPGDHRGTTRMAVYEARGGKIVRLSDWQEAPLGRDWEYE
jgi:branched-chain amino acid transport system substrate-binding protein